MVWDFGTGAILSAGAQTFSMCVKPPTGAKYQFVRTLRDPLTGSSYTIPDYHGPRARAIFEGKSVGALYAFSDEIEEITATVIENSRTYFLKGGR
jgi:hypothetical protein